MNVADTKPLEEKEKCCSRCRNIKKESLFIPKRNICKECRNQRCREKYDNATINDETEQICNVCNQSKVLVLFIKNRKICKDCNNLKRQEFYKLHPEHRIKATKQSIIRKQQISKEKKRLKELEIGIGNIKCKYCETIKPKERFRHNRLKCKDCERDDPISKIIRCVRTRILISIKQKNDHTVEYLGCNCSDYLKWLLTNNKKYTYENHGKDWHIDHVIPLSSFNLTDENEQKIAFNWRNTMPLSVKENLSKNNKIIKEQIEQHVEKLKKYHTDNNIILPQIYIDLFAKHLDAGSSLEPLLPLTPGNTCEELG